MLPGVHSLVKLFLENRKIKLLAFGSGIFISYAILGVLQERIFRGSYGTRAHENGETGDKFGFTVAFVAIQNIIYAITARTLIAIYKPPVNETRRRFFFFFGLFCVTASVTAYTSLRWIAYPTQVVAKASKPIFVMFMTVLFGKKSYSCRKYFFVLVTVLGIATFMFKSDQNFQNDYFGYCFIAISLTMDGLGGAVQDRMRRSGKKPHWMNFMFFNTGFSSCILISILAVTGEGRDLFDFVIEHPSVSWHLMSAVCAGTFGEICISLMIANFGSLPLSLVSVTRMFCTVLLSAFIYGNELSLRQWLSTVVVFSALLLDSFLCGSKKIIDDDEPKKMEAKKSIEADQDRFRVPNTPKMVQNVANNV